MKCWNNGRPQGFTYLEVLAALTILSVAIVPIMALMPKGMRTATRVERLTRSAFLAQSKMDEVRSQIFGSNASYGYSKDYTDPVSPTPPSAFPSPDTKYKYTIADDAGADIKVMNVTVWYDENNNGNIDTYSGAYQEDEPSISLDVKIAGR